MFYFSSIYSLRWTSFYTTYVTPPIVVLALDSICSISLCGIRSDGHGNPDPCGITGMGVTGTGMGEKKVTHDVSVPVLVGDGSMTCSTLMRDMSVTQY